MNIGTVAERSGVPAKTIRYYESVGLIAEPQRGDNGYRRYAQTDVETLRFVQRARSLGFSVRDVGDLLALWRHKTRASADVKALALRHIADMERRIAELESLRRTLVNLSDRCHGDDRPDCPILDDLAGVDHHR
ncbi:MAG: Cu(I)-responsive transcriptional regulator [Alphaproteobacteria bacterium]